MYVCMYVCMYWWHVERIWTVIWYYINCLRLSGAKRDADGYLWITGRIDDMLNVSGHLLSTADVESVLIEHPLVAETAVVAHPHSIKGECLYCFVTLKDVSQSLCLKFIPSDSRKSRQKNGLKNTAHFCENGKNRGKIMTVYIAANLKLFQVILLKLMVSNSRKIYILGKIHTTIIRWRHGHIFRQ